MRSAHGSHPCMIFQKRNWGPLLYAQISSYYLHLHVQRYWPRNVQVPQHVDPTCWRLDTARQLEEIKLPWFNELLVIRPIIIINHADGWSLLHLQKKTCLQKWLPGLKISLCQRTSTASLQYLTTSAATAAAELTVSYLSASTETATLT